MRFPINDNNPVLKSLINREEPSHPQEAALGGPQQAPSIYDTVTTDYPVDPQTGESEVVSTQTTSTQSTVDSAAIADNNITPNATSPVSVVSSDTTGYKFRVSADSPFAKLYGRAKLHLRALGKRQDPSPDTMVTDYDLSVPPADENTAVPQEQKLCGGPFDDPLCNKVGVEAGVSNDDSGWRFRMHAGGNKVVGELFGKRH